MASLSQFLGDAVLDVLITRHIFRTYRTLSPGRLHDLRSASVNNERLAACAAVGSMLKNPAIDC